MWWGCYFSDFISHHPLLHLLAPISHLLLLTHTWWGFTSWLLHLPFHCFNTFPLDSTWVMLSPHSNSCSGISFSLRSFQTTHLKLHIQYPLTSSLALFISIMFMSFWQSVYFTIMSLLQFPPTRCTLQEGRYLGLFWSVTWPLRNHAPFKIQRCSWMEDSTFPNPCCIQVMSFDNLSTVKYWWQ